MSRSRPTLVLLLACVAQFMLLVDDTITNVALPTIGRDLHFSVANLSWVVNAYLLTFGGLLLVGGRLADRFGPRRVFATSLVGFAAASALCGVAPSAGVLVGARALQGSFGALMSPSALALLLAASPGGAERRRARFRSGPDCSASAPPPDCSPAARSSSSPTGAGSSSSTCP